jgi:hypothetical protein
MSSRRLLGVASLLVGVSLASTATAGHVDVDSLPSATLPPLPARPKTVPAGQRMEAMRWDGPNADYGLPLTLSSEQPGCIFPGDDAPPPVPVTEDGSSPRPLALTDGIVVFGGELPRVDFFRHEAVVGEGQEAKLVIDRGVYDRQTRGVRAVDHVEVPLAVLSTTPLVYGFRADGMIDVVVPVNALNGLIGPTTRDPEGRIRSIACTHARVAVPVDGSGTAMVAGFLARRSDVKFAGRVEPGTLEIALSVTHTSRDPSPWVSLAIGVTR